MQLIGFSLEPLNNICCESIVRSLRNDSNSSFFILNTCQRLECYGFRVPSIKNAKILECFESCEAFERLCRIAAGLESRIIGELEILGQVREAYQVFCESSNGEKRKLEQIFQKVLNIARKARRESGIDKNLTSLTSIAAKKLLSSIEPDAPVAIVGSGSLAEGVCRYISERGNSLIRIAGRCPENAMKIAAKVQGFASGLDNMSNLFEGVSGIITATAAPHPVVYAKHLELAQKPLVIVDLGAPADCAEDVYTLSDVSYISLEHIEQKANVNKKEREKCAVVAREIIHRCSLKWAQNELQ